MKQSASAQNGRHPWHMLHLLSILFLNQAERDFPFAVAPAGLADPHFKTWCSRPRLRAVVPSGLKNALLRGRSEPKETFRAGTMQPFVALPAALILADYPPANIYQAESTLNSLSLSPAVLAFSEVALVVLE